MQRVPLVDRWLEDLRAYRRVALDTNVIIYTLGRVTPYWELSVHLFRMMNRGLILGTISTVVEVEVLVKPLRQRDRVTLDRVELFLREAPNLVVRPLDRIVARRAAQVRAFSNLKLPDAIIVATALEERCDVIIGNDADIARQVTSIPYLCLDSYLS